MHLANKIIIWLIFLALLPYFYFSAKTLKTHDYWRSRYNQKTDDLKKAKAENYIYFYGEGDPSDPKSKPSLPRLEITLKRVQAFRGYSTWFDCRVVPDRLGNVVVTIPGINETILSPGSSVYAFEVSSEDVQGKYLGVFKVEDVVSGEVSLSPDLEHYKNPRVANAIKSSTANWNLYTVMPSDEHEVFNMMDTEELRDFLSKNLPPSEVGAYQKDGKPDSKTGMVYVRQLTDYDKNFILNQAMKMMLQDQIIVETIDRDATEDILKEAEIQVSMRTDEKQQLLEQGKKYAAEKKAISDFNKQLSERVRTLDARIKQYYGEIRQKAAMIVERDRKAFDRAPSAASQ